VTRHLVIHQFDPTRHVVGGVDGFIRDVISHSGDARPFAVVGVEHGAKSALGHWRTVELNGQAIQFMPVARIEAGNQRRRIPHSLRLAYGLFRYRRRIGDAIIHNHRSELGAVTSVLFPRAARVQFIHDDALQAFRWRKETMWRFFPRAYEAVERRAVRSAATAFVMSRATLERLRRRSLPASLGVNWYDGANFHPTGRVERTGPLRIGWAGRLEPPKDPVTAVGVLAGLRARGVDFEAWIAGEGTLAADVRAALDEHGLAGIVRMIGALPPSDLGAELRRTDVFLMTSLWEGIPRVALEALACGVPVVSPAVGELPSLVSNSVNGFISSSRSVDDLVAAVVHGAALEPGDAIASSVATLEVRSIVPELLERIEGSAAHR
jgi:glycosyltransferase involved in cell wall biosynthesis